MQEIIKPGKLKTMLYNQKLCLQKIFSSHLRNMKFLKYNVFIILKESYLPLKNLFF